MSTKRFSTRKHEFVQKNNKKKIRNVYILMKFLLAKYPNSQGFRRQI